MALDWALYRRASLGCVARTEDAWFEVPYRSRSEALAQAFGKDWVVTEVPVRADFVLPGVLLTHPDDGFRVLTHFFPARWYPEENAPENRDGGRFAPRGRVRELRRTLQNMVDQAVGAPTLSGLIRLYGLRVGQNPQAYAYLPALFDVWLGEQGVFGEQADALRVLAGLGGFETMRQIVSETEKQVSCEVGF